MQPWVPVLLAGWCTARTGWRHPLPFFVHFLGIKWNALFITRASPALLPAPVFHNLLGALFCFGRCRSLLSTPEHCFLRQPLIKNIYLGSFAMRWSRNWVLHLAQCGRLVSKWGSCWESQPTLVNKVTAGAWLECPTQGHKLRRTLLFEICKSDSWAQCCVACGQRSTKQDGGRVLVGMAVVTLWVWHLYILPWLGWLAVFVFFVFCASS